MTGKKKRKVVVTGMGCVSAAGHTLQENMAALFQQQVNAAPPERFSTDHPTPYPVFEVKEKTADTYSRTCGLLLSAAGQALATAGDALSGKRIGVCLGTAVGSTPNNISFYDGYRSGGIPDMTPVHRFLSSNPAAFLADRYGLAGPVQTVVNACSSGTDAIGIASSWVEQGLCDMAIAGGADELSKVSYNGFSSLMIMDADPVKPFDESRAGLNLGEGAAVLILEAESGARAREKQILGRILGYGTSCDGYHPVAPHPEGLGLKKAIGQALAFSRTAKNEIAFVNAHGTGTRDNDRVESIVMDTVLPGVPFFSTKGCTGHTLGAAGALEAVYTIACLNRGEIPPSTGFTTPAQDTPRSPVSEPTRIEGRAALSQSLAFGGNNAVLVLGRGEQ